MAPADTKEPEGLILAPPKLEEGSDMIDISTFEQILEMDDYDDREFSKEIVYGFFEQAEQTFKKMEDAIGKKDLPELSSLGQVLEASSATLGLTHVKDGAKKIQYLGAGSDETGCIVQSDKDVALDSIEKTVNEVKVAYSKVETFLRLYYGELAPKK